jgi:hypothetical protein
MAHWCLRSYRRNKIVITKVIYETFVPAFLGSVGKQPEYSRDPVHPAVIACLGARFDVLRDVRTSGEQSCKVLPL